MSYLLRARRILTLTGNGPIQDGYVLVQGDRITAVGPGHASDLPRETQVIDLGDRTLLPGLIDCHTHVSGLHRGGSGASPDQQVAADTVEVVAGLDRLVRSGVTTIRDCGYPHGGVFAIRNAALAGLIAAPRMYLAGRSICAVGGHGASLSVEVDGPDAVRRAVRTESKAGAEWIKLMATGGTATPGEEVTDVQLSREEIGVAVEEAHRRNRGVCAHCSNLAGAHLLLDAGIDSIEHGIELDDAAVTRMAKQKVWLVTTLRCTEIEGTAGPESGIADFIRTKAAGIYQRQMASFQRALAAGVLIAAGTDAEQPYLPLGLPTLVSELELMTRLGMTPMQAIQTATRNAAALLRSTDIGAIEPGRKADLLAVEGNPAEDISSLGSPWLVMAGGRLVAGPDA